MSELTTIMRLGADIQRVWWTGHVQHGAHMGQAFVQMVGHFRGTPLECVRFIVQHIDLLRRGVKLSAFEANAEPCQITVRTWGNASDMLLSASRALDSLVPALVPLPVGFGVLYIGNPITEDEWADVRAFKDAYRRRQQSEPDELTAARRTHPESCKCDACEERRDAAGLAADERLRRMGYRL